MDLKSEEGRQVVEELIADADVLVENYSLGVMERFGLGYEYLISEVNPELVYASIEGYGEEGPDKDRRGWTWSCRRRAGSQASPAPRTASP